MSDWTAEQVQELHQLYRLGLTAKQILHRTRWDKSRSAVCGRLARDGVLRGTLTPEQMKARKAEAQLDRAIRDNERRDRPRKSLKNDRRAEDAGAAAYWSAHQRTNSPVIRQQAARFMRWREMQP